MDPLKSPAPSNQPVDGSDDPKLNDVSKPVDENAPAVDSPLGDVATDNTVSKPTETDDTLGLASESPASDNSATDFGGSVTPSTPGQASPLDVPTDPVSSPDTPPPSDDSAQAPVSSSGDVPSTVPVTAPGSSKSILLLGIVGLVLVAGIILMVVL